MGQYKIYAGLNGSFGGAGYVTTIECDHEEEAEEYAFEEACDLYESYAGLHGIPSKQEILDNYIKDNNIEKLSEEDYINIQDLYSDERENWITYYAQKV